MSSVDFLIAVKRKTSMLLLFVVVTFRCRSVQGNRVIMKEILDSKMDNSEILTIVNGSSVHAVARQTQTISNYYLLTNTANLTYDLASKPSVITTV
ncbi:hypothetical protein ACI65C_004878 [Semiaphis heraclei]